MNRKLTDEEREIYKKYLTVRKRIEIAERHGKSGSLLTAILNGGVITEQSEPMMAECYDVVKSIIDQDKQNLKNIK